MPSSKWTAWPTREALSRLGIPRVRTALDVTLLAGLSAWAVYSAYDADVFHGRGAVLPPLGLLCCVLAALSFQRTTLANRLLPSLGLIGGIVAVGMGAYAAGTAVPAMVPLISASLMATERLPLMAGLGSVAVMSPGFALTADSDLGAVCAIAAVLLGGCSLRLDAQARGAGFRLLAQERAAREAEATSAALAERARIAREIHDVLAHSLSAQLVHLEAARLQIEREPEGPFRAQILERVVAARSMAREGLEETRQALSALRGEMVPVEDYLRELAVADGAETGVRGERRQLTAEASQAVRRVAQEALTNVRKHAPGARVRMLLTYAEAEVALEVRDSGTTTKTGEVGATGAGYGLLGMRERAELLGGTLEAGPEGEGFVVRLRVPA
ncbi:MULTISPECIES: histidine kinase [unclassified Streptomyces]|uniref:sensor histidine kinase n=1 Tax=unclassified Streptomyces TaxID=2593676 RepID=UPI002DDAFCA8|nr:histidine kinase [Streptomyces sp. NBC_01750]WSA99797.1 histidine kinase [Streptomyces sp. NBC_01794]WSD35771.1 histidine kinase [Streptomyces sp. NBC_01750]